MLQLPRPIGALFGLILMIGLGRAQDMAAVSHSELHIVGEPIIAESAETGVPIEQAEIAADQWNGLDVESQHGALDQHAAAGHDHGIHVQFSDNDESARLQCKCAGREKRCQGVCRDPGRPKKPKCTKPGDRDWGDCPPKRYRLNDCDRAGNPHCVAPWARCSVNGKYSAWFVGGGAAFFRGRGRSAQEGTWGLDYDGCFGCINNWLTYTRCRTQGGEGAYETDGEPEFVSRACELLPFGH